MINYIVAFIVFILCATNGLYSGVRVKLFKDNALVFAGNSTPELAQKVCNNCHISIGKATVGKFNDKETQIQIMESVRDKDVFIIQSTCSIENQTVNDALVELYLLIRTIKRSSARSITVVIPYFGYARQDRKTRSRVPISAADIAYLLEMSGVTRVITVDLHCGQIQGFFQNTPVDNLCAAVPFSQYIAKKNLKKIVVVSPDVGGVERANQFILELNKKGQSAELAIISKQRAAAGVVSVMHLIGDVDGADAIIVDDMCDTGGTLVKAAQLLKDNGANQIFAAITHPVFSGQALDIIGKSVINEMIIADTIPLQKELPSNITVISVAQLIANAIMRIQLGESLSELFR